MRRHHRAILIAEGPAIFLIAVYGGYFGAPAGVLLLALRSTDTSPRLSPPN